ncbi:MAG: hypothetical protein ACI85I_002615 [Arenicella sp.]
MGILDLFRKKKEPLTLLIEAKEEISLQVGELKGLSEKLQMQVDSLAQLSEGSFESKLSNTHNSLEKSRKAISEVHAILSDFSYYESPKNDFEEQARIVGMNLGALNAVIEMELKDSNSHMKAFNKFCTNITSCMAESESLIESMPLLSEKLLSLNTKIDVVISDLETRESNLES